MLVEEKKTCLDLIWFQQVEIFWETLEAMRVCFCLLTSCGR